MTQNQILEKMKFSVLLIVFVVTLVIGNIFRPNINDVRDVKLANDIVGVGKIKSEKIVAERELHGDFKDEKDFRDRTKDYIGDVVFNRITKTYRFN